MSYHFFTDPEYAGPHHSAIVAFWDRKPRLLREIPRKSMPEYHFPNSNTASFVQIATKDAAPEISRFFNMFYKGDDWTFNCNFSDVEHWIKSGFIIIIKFEDEIVGTFVCRNLEHVICGKPHSQSALLEGLVVHPQFRKTGLASFLLASMDYIVYNTPHLRTSILFWFREHDSHLSALSQLPLCVLKYSYINIKKIVKRSLNINKITSEHASKIVTSIAENNSDVFTLICTRSDPNVYWCLVNGSLIGIANTHRNTHTGAPIWEVVFAANISKPYFVDLLDAIEQSALMLPSVNGILFISNSKSRGNTVPAYPWVSGSSGFLTTHIYNWMPPHFLTGDILFPLSCI